MRIPSLKLAGLGIAAVLVLAAIPWGLSSVAAASERAKKEPIYVSIFFHLEKSPIRGLPGRNFSGDGPAPGSRMIHAALDLFEELNIRAELATTGIFAQQLADDYPADIERIKRMKFPITRYPGVGHAQPNPVGRGNKAFRDVAGRSDAASLSAEMVTAWWDYETKTLVPGWRLAGGQLVLGNPKENQPISKAELADYNIPVKDTNVFGGTLAIQKIFGVTPMATFPPLFEGQRRVRGPDLMQRALGSGSFAISQTPSPAGLPQRAPIQQSGRWKDGVPPKYYGKRLGEAPARADMVTWLRLLAQNQPRNVPYMVQLYLTAGQPIWEGGRNRDGFVRILRFVAAHSDDFQFVWPDPEAWQWAPENRPEVFYQKTYGVSSLDEVLKMEAPVSKIRELAQAAGARPPAAARPPRGTEGRTGARLPDRLMPAETTLDKATLLKAADYLLTHWPTGDHDGNFGGPPPYIKAGEQRLSLSEAFQGFLISLDNYLGKQSLPAQVTVRELVGPVKYPQYALGKEPARDPKKLIGGYLGAELDPEYFPDLETVFRQGLPPAGGGLNIVWPLCTTADVEDFFYAVTLARKEMDRDGHIPAEIPLHFSEERSFGQRQREKIRAIVNPAEFFYGLAQQYRLVGQQGKPGAVMMISMNVIAAQRSQFVMPSIPATFEGGMKGYQQMNGFIRRRKVPDWAIQNAWNYKP